MNNFVDAFVHAVGDATLLPWFVGLVASLALCALGYPVLRILLVFVGLMFGTLLGAAFAQMMAQARPVPTDASGVDLLVACGALSIVLAVASWFLYRLMVAVYAGIGLFAGIVYAAGQPVPPAAVALGVTGGVLLAAMVFLFTRWIVIALTAACGAMAAVDCCAALVTDQKCRLWPPAMDPAQNPAVTVLLVVAAAGVLVGGVLVQAKMPNLVVRSLARPAPESKPGRQESKPDNNED